jgi:hypothetical protein
MLTVLPRPFRHILFEHADENLNTIVNHVFDSLALLMPDASKLVGAKRVLLMLGPKPSEFDFKPLEDLHADLSKLGPGFAALFEDALESGEIFVESPIRIESYSPAIRHRLEPLQAAADRLNELPPGTPAQAARIVLGCLRTLYPDTEIGPWLSGRGCSEEIVRDYL